MPERAPISRESGSATAVLEGSKLAITGSFDGLKTAATTANLHSAVAAGVRGPVIADLTIAKATSGTITGSVDLTARTARKPASRRALRRDSQRESPGRRPVGLAAEIGDCNHEKNYVAPAILSPVLLSLIAIGILTGQQTATGPYTAAQADAGRTAYQANCAGCHGPDLGGRNDAAQLAGSLFMGSWGNRTTSDLIGFMHGAMPPGNPGSLGEATYLNIAAFILDSNGARPGTQALTATTSVGIRSIATGQPRLQVAQAGRGGRGGRGGARQPMVRSVDAPKPPSHQPPEASPSPAKSKTTRPSPTPCCAIPIPTTGS